MVTVIILGAVLHLLIGTVLSRQHYAREVARRGTKETEALIAKRRFQLKSIKHGSHCWRGPSYNSTTRDCDCLSSRDWKMWNNELLSLEENGWKPPSPYLMVFFWPALGYHAFLTGGKVDTTPALRSKEWEQKMEQELLELDS